MMKQDETLGFYAHAWMEFMDTYHPELAQQMQGDGTYERAARAVEHSANDYRDLLNRQYAQQNPPPEGLSALRAWYHTRDFYVNSMVMRENVLVAVTTP